MTRILISGLLAFNSGKTSVALSIASSAVEKGIYTGICKPISAFNAWYQYGSVIQSIKTGKLLGEDVCRLHRAVNSDEKIEIESPVVFLHAPPDPERVGWDTSMYTAMGLSDVTVVYRISDCEDTRHYVVSGNLKRLSTVMRKKIENLLEFLQPPPIESGKFVLEEILTGGRTIADECVEYLAEKYDVLVIESFNNASAPTSRSLDVEKVVVVAPGKLAVYSGRDYRRAMYAISDIRAPWRITVDNLVSLLKPENVMELQPDSRGICYIDIEDIIEEV